MKTTGAILHLWFKKGLFVFLTGEESKVLICILEKITCSDHRESLRDKISISQFVKSTGLSRPTVISSLRVLINAKIIFASIGAGRNGREYRISLDEPNLSEIHCRSTQKKASYKKKMTQIRSMPFTSQCHLPDTLINNLDVTKNFQSVNGIDTPDILSDKHKRLSDIQSISFSEKPVNKKSDFSIFGKVLKKSKDKVLDCKKIMLESNDDEVKRVADNLHEILSYLRGAGAESEVETRWLLYLKYSHRIDTNDIFTLHSQMREGIESGKIRNIGSVYVEAIKKIAKIRGIDLTTKRGMAKAPAASHQNQTRKVA